MLGLIRFCLAGFVAWSHTLAYPLWNIQLGVSSVVAFYFISGFLMAKTYPRFASNKNPILSFYTDRIFRLYPAFLLWFVISCLYYYYCGYDFSKTNLIGEVLLIPQNYHFVTSNITNHMIDPAWSLGAEFQWYLLVPLIALISNITRWVLLVAMLSGQILVFSLQILGISNDSCSLLPLALFDRCFHLSDLLGYRLLVFASAAFLLGHVTSHMQWRGRRFIFLLGYCFSILWIIYIWHGQKLPRFNDVMFAYVVMLPLIILSMTVKIKNRGLHKIDMICGKLSYPVFLTHFLAINVMDRYFPAIFNLSGFNLEFTKTFFAGCITLGFSAILMYIQDKIDVFRIKYRGFKSLRYSNPF